MSNFRVVLPGFAHHVCQRGVRKEPIFQDDRDYLVYIRVLKDSCSKRGVDIWAYSLMPNHDHLVAVPKEEDSISKALHDAHGEYAGYFNTKYGFSGHVWESRPGIYPMDFEYLVNAMRYVERNPVRARMVKRAEHYAWSSAAAHCGLRDDILLSGSCPLVGIVQNWSEWLDVEQDEEELMTIRDHTSRGNVMCSPEALAEIEARTGKRLTPRKRGRPQKQENPGLTGNFDFSD